MNTPIRTLVVDDEMHARAKIIDLLSHDPSFSVIGEASHGDMAIEKILTLKPDMVFLDIQMPKPDGFGVLNHIPKHQLPYIIFVTAFHDYAVKAFEMNALDYLLKPFNEQRFNESLERAKKTFESNRKAEIIDRISSLKDINLSSASATYPDRIPVKTNGKIFLTQAKEIHYIEADGNHVIVQTDSNKYSCRQTLTEWSGMLDPSRFFRVHRSVIVNVDKIVDLQHWSKGDYVITMPNNKRFFSSRKYRGDLERLLRIS
jgi:two-component system, LytTR family, response regulator